MDYNKILEYMWTDVQELMPGHLEHLAWTREQLRDYQTKALRDLLKSAKENTVFIKKHFAQSI